MATITPDERDQLPLFEEQIRAGIIAEMRAGARPIPLDYKKPSINGKHFHSNSIVKQINRVLWDKEEVLEQYNYEVEGKNQQDILKISLDYVIFEDYKWVQMKSGYELALEEVYDYEEEEMKYHVDLTGVGKGDDNDNWMSKERFSVRITLTERKFFELFHKVQQNRGTRVGLKPCEVFTTMDHQSVRVIKNEKTGEMEVKTEQAFDWVDKKQVIDYYKSQTEKKNGRRTRTDSKSGTSKAGPKSAKV